MKLGSFIATGPRSSQGGLPSLSHDVGGGFQRRVVGLLRLGLVCLTLFFSRGRKRGNVHF